MKIDENHCPQLIKDSHLTVFPVKFRDTLEGNDFWFELSGGS